MIRWVCQYDVILIQSIYGILHHDVANINFSLVLPDPILWETEKGPGLAMQNRILLRRSSSRAVNQNQLQVLVVFKLLVNSMASNLSN